MAKSPLSINDGRTPNPSHAARARRAEERVCAYLKNLGWNEIMHDSVCNGVQVDILARTPPPQDLLTLIEVKMQGPSGLARLSRIQARRLGRVMTSLAQHEPIQILLAFIEGRKVRLLPVDALTDF